MTRIQILEMTIHTAFDKYHRFIIILDSWTIY